MTVPDLDAALARHADTEVIGQLFLDADGMVITFLDGPLPLELFNFPDGDVLPDPGTGEPDLLGIRAVHA